MRALWLAVALSGCFHPSYDNTHCGPAGECPSGFACNTSGVCESGTGDGGTGSDACVGLQCQITSCPASGQSSTMVTGTVFAPNGTLALSGVDIYVPNEAPGPFSDTLQCNTCAVPLPGSPVTHTTSLANGSFVLPNVPAGDKIPIVITVGHWRRQLMIAHIDPCSTVPLAAADTTLPKSRADLSANTTSVDLPKIAISVGAADALECLVRKIGIADSEFGIAGEDKRVQLFNDLTSENDATAGYSAGVDNGATFPDSNTLWGLGSAKGAAIPATFASYDLVMLSCEGEQPTNSTDATSMANLKQYADTGGRVMMSHWHNLWIEGNTTGGGSNTPAVWPSIATFDDTAANLPSGTTDDINTTSNAQGSAFATWMFDVGASGVEGQIPIGGLTGRETCQAIDPTKAEEWVSYLDPSTGAVPQIFEFATPNEEPAAQRCGKVIFSDMHVSSDSSSSSTMPFPTACATSTLSPQETALAYLFFEIGTCPAS